VSLEPLFALRLRTPRLELRLPRDDELELFAAVAERGIHPPEEMPFYVPWTDGSGEPAFRESFAAHHLEHRASWRPERWTLSLGVWAGAEPVGIQSLRWAERVVETGSWLGRAFQGRGYGTEMRGAAIELAFAVGADAVTSGSLAGNAASARVSEKLGYAVVGERTAAPRGEPVLETRYRLDRGGWQGAPVEIDGLPAALPLFGVTLP